MHLKRKSNQGLKNDGLAVFFSLTCAFKGLRRRSRRLYEEGEKAGEGSCGGTKIRGIFSSSGGTPSPVVTLRPTVRRDLIATKCQKSAANFRQLVVVALNRFGQTCCDLRLFPWINTSEHPNDQPCLKLPTFPTAQFQKIKKNKKE